MAVEKRKGTNSWRVLFPDPQTGWDPPGQQSFGDEQTARNFDRLWKLRKSQDRMGELWAEVFPQEAEADRHARGILFGDFLIDAAFPHWRDTPGRGRSHAKEAKSVGQMRDWVTDHVFEALYERDHHGHARRDREGVRIVSKWGPSEALCWMPIDELDPAVTLAFDRRLRTKQVGDPPHPVGDEVRRKVLSFLQQAFDHAVVVYPELYGRPNPFSFVRKPTQSGVQTVRAMTPEIVEVMRAEWRLIETLSHFRVRGLISREQARTLRAHGWPIPEDPYLARFTAAFISAAAYSSARPQELLGASQAALKPPRLIIRQHNVDGRIRPGTKSTRFPRKRALLIGPGASDLAEWKQWLQNNFPVRPMLLFPDFDGGAWNATAYRNWRARYYVPVAKRNGLRDADPDDGDGEEPPGSPRPGALRHIYATMRVAAHHDTLAIERSMGTSLVREVYADVIEDWEEQGALDIDATVAAARSAAPQIASDHLRASTGTRGTPLDVPLSDEQVEAVIRTTFPALALSA